MKRNQKNATHYGKTALRLMGYIAGTFRLQFAAVFITIIISALAGTAGPLFLMFLIDDFITPPPAGGAKPRLRRTFQGGSGLGRTLLCGRPMYLHL